MNVITQLALIGFLAVSVFSSNALSAQVPDYPGHPAFAVQDIDPDLLIDAQSVVRVNEI